MANERGKTSFEHDPEGVRKDDRKLADEKHLEQDKLPGKKTGERNNPDDGALLPDND